jgi:hypothetical protein
MRLRRWACVLALGVWALPGLPSAPARADGSAEPPGETDQVVKIGPQAVVIKSEHGDVRMYDDPSQQVQGCRSVITCWGVWAVVGAGIAISARTNFTVNVAGAGAPTVVGAPAAAGEAAVGGVP